MKSNMIIDNKLEQLWKLFYEKNKSQLHEWDIKQDLEVNGLALRFGCFLCEIIVKHENRSFIQDFEDILENINKLNNLKDKWQNEGLAKHEN